MNYKENKPTRVSKEREKIMREQIAVCDFAPVFEALSKSDADLTVLLLFCHFCYGLCKTASNEITRVELRDANMYGAARLFSGAADAIGKKKAKDSAMLANDLAIHARVMVQNIRFDMSLDGVFRVFAQQKEKLLELCEKEIFWKEQD